MRPGSESGEAMHDGFSPRGVTRGLLLAAWAAISVRLSRERGRRTLAPALSGP